MALELTDNARLASEQSTIEPNLVLEIDGVDTVFGAITITKVAKYGDAIKFGDPGLVYGGQIAIEDQESLISFQQGTTTRINQILRLDKGMGESISFMEVALVDKDQIITQLITPDTSQSPTFDLLGRRAKIWFMFKDTAFKDDAIIIFRGLIDNIVSFPGLIKISLTHPDSIKKQTIFTAAETFLTSAMGIGDVVADVDDATDFLNPQPIGPDGGVDTDIEFMIRIDNEIIKYGAKSGVQFSSLVRGQLGTVASAHDINADISSNYRLTGNIIDLALKFMLSGTDGPYVEDAAITNFVRIDAGTAINNAIFFQDFNLDIEFNVQVGDFITTTGAANGANNVVNKQITDIVQVDDSFYILIDGVTFVEENLTNAVIDFRSQFDVWGAGAGLAMKNDEVDIPRHLELKDSFFAAISYDFLLKDTIENGKEFLSEQIYNPSNAFSIPRKAQSSLGIHLSVILPTQGIKTLDASNVKLPAKINLRRATTRNFFNNVIYKIDESRLEDRFLAGRVVLDADSTARIPVGNKSLIIESKGMRSVLGGKANADTFGNRRLKKFRFGAEFLTLKTNFKTGFNIEIGDAVLLVMSDLQITDIVSGTREGEPRIFEVINKILDIKTTDITLELLDANIDKDARAGLVSPTSRVKEGISTTQFIIEESFGGRFGQNEFKKWEDQVGAGVTIREVDFSTQGTSLIDSVDGNQITLSTALGFTPSAGMILEHDIYDNQPDNTKLVYAFISDGSNDFNDGKPPYIIV